MGEINLACGACDWCRQGLGRHCPNRTVLGIGGHAGAFSELFTLPETNLFVLPDRLSTEDAVFAEPVAAACEILEQLTIPPGSPVAVLGDGKLGLLVAQVLAASGLDVRLFGRHPEKLAVAARAGITTALSQTRPSGPVFQWVVEATGSPEGFRQAVEMTRPRGTIVLKSTVHGSVPVDTAPVVVNEITLVGSRCGRFGPALELLANNRLDVAGMIAGEFPLCDAPEAFARAATRGTLKILLRN